MEERKQADGGSINGNKDDSFAKDTSSRSAANKKNKQQRKNDVSNSPAASSSSSASSLSMPPLPFPPEFAAKCLNAATAAAVAGGNVNLSTSGGASVTITKGRMFGPSPPPAKSNVNSKEASSKNLDSSSTTTTTNIDLAALAQSGFSFADLGIDIPSGSNNSSDDSNQKNAAPCSEAEMKALMSMFVEFVGMVSDQDNIGRNNNSGDSSGNKHPNPTISRENFIRLNAAALAAASASNLQGQNNSASFSNKSSAKPGAQNSSSPFPVFSMLLGAGAGGVGGSSADFSAESIKLLSKKMNANNLKNSANSNSRGVHASAPQAYPVNSSESGSEWIDYGEDEANDNENTDQTNRSVNDGDDGSIEDLIIDEHGQTNRDQFLKWSRKIHSVINVADTFTRDNRKNSSPLRHKRTKQHPQNMEKLHHSHLQSIKGNKFQNKTSNWDSATQENGFNDLYNNEKQSELIGKDEEEKAKKAAKKREKKNRKKEKAKREAALKAAQSAQKRRDAKITSWRSRVVTACSNGEIGKLEALLGDSPFKNLEKSSIIQNIDEKHEFPTKKESVDEESSDITGDISSLNEFANDDVPQHMEWLLHACFPKYNQKQSKSEREAKLKLSFYVMKLSFDVIFQPIRNGRNLVHAAAQTGDVEFIKHVLDRLKSTDMEHSEISSNLNILCEDAGWSPLHYASAFGCTEVIEVLLAGGSDVTMKTEQTLTRLCRNSTGVTARGLVECLKSGDVSSLLECDGKALNEALDNSKGVESRTAIFDSIVSRLTDVQENGYSPLSQGKTNHEKVMNRESGSKTSAHQSSRTHQHSSEDAKKKKRNRKKKGQQQPLKSQSEPGNNAASNSETQKTEIDPLVTALLSMGFTSSQISAAAKACGGTENATADDLVAWIFGSEAGNNEESQPQEQTKASNQDPILSSASGNAISSGSKNPSSSSNSLPMHNHVTMLKAQHQQRMADKAAEQVMKEEEEAAEREREAKAAAQRLAAKREEQRRINREWNNREQNRQKEEAQAKLKEEMEKRRASELSKAKEAQKRVQLVHPHSMINSQNHTTHVRIGHHQPIPHPSIVLQNPISSVSPHPSHFQNQHTIPIPLSPVEPKHYEMLPPDIHPMNTTAPSQPDGMGFRHGRSYQNQVFGSPSPHGYIPDQSSNEFNNTANIHPGSSMPAFADNVGYQVENYSKAPTQRGKKLEVNNFEFPELGKEKAARDMKAKVHQSNNAPPFSDHNLPSGGISGRKNQRGKGRNSKQKNSFSPANMKKNTSSISPPGFQPPSTTYTEPMKNATVESNEMSAIDEPNQLGEIRATAKVFVPTFFKPPPSDKDASEKSTNVSAPIGIQDQNSVIRSQVTPPPFARGFSLPMHGTDAFSTSPNAPRSDPLDTTVDLLAPMNSLLSSSNHSHRKSESPMSGDPTALLPPMSSSALSSHTNSAPSSMPHSPIQSSASSIAGGMSIGDEQGMIGNAMMLDSHLVAPRGESLILGSLNRSVSKSSTLENVPVTGSASIWGDASTSSTGLGSFSAFGISTTSSLGVNQNELGSNTKEDINDTAPGGWSSGGVLGGNPSSGSIW